MLTGLSLVDYRPTSAKDICDFANPEPNPKTHKSLSLKLPTVGLYGDFLYNK